MQQAEALKAGRIDVGFGRLRLDDPAITTEVVMEERLIVAMNTTHKLRAKKSVRLAQLVGEPIILYPAKPRPSYADEVLNIFRSRNLEITVVMEANELQTTIGLVAGGVGIALVPESVKRLHRDDVTYRPLADPGVISPILMNCRAWTNRPS